MAGNLRHARLASEDCLTQARLAGFKKYIAASQVNLAALGLYLGDLKASQRFARDVLKDAGDLPYLRISVLDTLAQGAMGQDQDREAKALLDQCAEAIAAQRLPARSWYDLAHQLTRCTYFERQEDWERVLALVDDTEPEVARRQFRALRTALLCARARALAPSIARIRPIPPSPPPFAAVRAAPSTR